MSQFNSVSSSNAAARPAPGHWLVTCPRGVEGLLAAELQPLGGAALRERVAGVEADGDLEFGYRTCLWSRLANRVLWQLVEAPVADADDLYQVAHSIGWEQLFAVDTGFTVDFTGTSGGIRHTRFGAQRVKDAIADRFRAACGQRPPVDREAPAIRVDARLHRGRLVIGLDFAGTSLHRRGYRSRQLAAPLKENLAAALLRRAGWPEIAARGGELLDPLCGSGTLVIEAALIAADAAPGLLRERFGFHAWRGHDAGLWAALRAEAEQRRAAGLARLPRLRGRDRDPAAIAISRANAAAAGLGEQIEFTCSGLEDFGRPGPRGLVIANPPYGERLGEIDELRGTYRALGAAIKRECPGWRAAIFTANAELGHELGLKAERRYRLYNGALAGELLVCAVHTAEQAAAARAHHEARATEHRAGVAMLENRLIKNQRRLAPWRQREGVQCYRLYDADLPEYAVAIDCYGAAVHLQEYAPPASVPAATARRRLREVLEAVAAVVQPDPDLVFTKVRERQSGTRQYQPSVAPQAGGLLVVSEGRARFEVNLGAYLDTGLFLDHRPVRRLLAALAPGKRLLNLFCYTATATVQAALGGAAESLSIDLSNTYLDWARRNFALNGIDPAHHRLLRADCLEWLARAAQGGPAFDLILLDPPTFSNSKRMGDTLDIQRDHAGLIASCMALLAPGGTLVFSTNFRRFRLSAEIAERYRVEDVSARTLDPDFRRDARIHRCWLIRARSES
ncbi:MAG: bifunctional 23S rRNA (guanine(2069)-N(7))-methyltransferase RlmK/23S rRNA (guanine(2445)-N(2))-methyltransferase RlmL [Pseudomonadales bacterium]|nr:bifunctional 23S rRNA (guanine(2069)-N(7))-methyltransferase RlmK/23S rRNA (guanine(2445)-N(2))-methyltransferase RlmL [Pseudomonadales bacterium]